MEISVRSYLTVSTAAVVGAGAIALTPVLPSNSVHSAYLPAPAVAEVNLTGFGISLGDIVGVLQNFGSGLLPDLGGLSPAVIAKVVAEFVKEASPVVMTSAGDVLQYVGGAVSGLVFGPNSLPARFGSDILAIPGVVKTALGDVTNGQFLAALVTLNAGLLAPIKSIGQVLFDTANGIASFVSNQVGTLVSALPGILMSAIQAAVGPNAQALIDTVKTALSGLITKLSNISFPGGWSGGWSEGSHHHHLGNVSGGSDEGSGEGNDTEEGTDDVVTPPVAAASVAVVSVPRAVAPRAAASAAPGDSSAPSDSAAAVTDSTDTTAPGVRRGAVARQASTSSPRGRQTVERPKAAASARAK